MSTSTTSPPPAPPPKTPQPVLHPCPNCGQEDSGTHSFTTCSHPHMKGRILQRHNDAVQIIAEAIRNSTKLPQSGYLTMDAGIADQLNTKPDSHLPQNWLLNPNLPNQQDTLPYKPDILFIPGLFPHQHIPTTQLERQEYTIYIIEVGYGGDTRYTEKLAEKEAQHKDIREHLTKAGWRVQYYPLILGVSGTIYLTLPHFLTQTLGHTSKDSDSIILRLQKSALTHGLKLNKTRRHLEHGGTITTTPGQSEPTWQRSTSTHPHKGPTHTGHKATQPGHQTYPTRPQPNRLPPGRSQTQPTSNHHPHPPTGIG